MKHCPGFSHKIQIISYRFVIEMWKINEYEYLFIACNEAFDE